ncbi:MAG: hypothetical protein BJG00_008100 [Limnothrix sp. CACIAM 69d]|nr:MAG: hypothetical protein BJG00_008100 [Limnothrix sp. CACIAM 69d]
MAGKHKPSLAIAHRFTELHLIVAARSTDGPNPKIARCYRHLFIILEFCGRDGALLKDGGHFDPNFGQRRKISCILWRRVGRHVQQLNVPLKHDPVFAIAQGLHQHHAQVGIGRFFVAFKGKFTPGHA